MPVAAGLPAISLYSAADAARGEPAEWPGCTVLNREATWRPLETILQANITYENRQTVVTALAGFTCFLPSSR